MESSIDLQRQSLRSDAPSHAAVSLVSERLALLLLGQRSSRSDLPGVADLVIATIALAEGSRRKITLKVATAPLELVLVRSASDVLVSYYEVGAVIDVFVLDRRIALASLLDGCSHACSELATHGSPEIRANCERLLEKLSACVPVATAPLPGRMERCGGALDEPTTTTAVAFGFRADLRERDAGESATGDSLARTDVHATLFDGAIWVWARGRRAVVAKGAIWLAIERMVAGVRMLLEAAESERSVNLRLRAGSFTVGLRRDREGTVALSFGAPDEQPLTIPQLTLEDAAGAVLRLASDLVRAVLGQDRAQIRNLRVSQLRRDVRELKKMLSARKTRAGFENADPDRFRLSAPPAEPTSASAAMPFGPIASDAGRLRFATRWRRELEGVDAASTFLCGERIVVATPRRLTALSRETGETLWQENVSRGVAVMAGTTLLRLGSEGSVELWDVARGEMVGRARIGPRVGGPPCGTWAGGGSIPPIAVIAEGTNRLVAIDLRTGEPSWRFSTRGGGVFRFRRTGRLMFVVSGDSTVHALDVATGEEVWRISDRRRFGLAPAMTRDTAVFVGTSGDASGCDLLAVDVYSGRVRWRRAAAETPTTVPMVTDDKLVIGLGDARSSSLTAFEVETGEPAWMLPDPGIARGAAALPIDGALVVNTPSGRVCALDVARGSWLWSTTLTTKSDAPTPRRLEPVLRGGALFVPGATVTVLRPSDGASLGAALECDIVPDLLRVDERGWLYVAEDGGEIRAFGPMPHLRLVR